MSLKSRKIFKNSQIGLDCKLKFSAFISQVRLTSKYQQNKCLKLFKTSI